VVDTTKLLPANNYSSVVDTAIHTPAVQCVGLQLVQMANGSIQFTCAYAVSWTNWRDANLFSKLSLLQALHTVYLHAARPLLKYRRVCSLLSPLLPKGRSMYRLLSQQRVCMSLWCMCTIYPHVINSGAQKQYFRLLDGIVFPHSKKTWRRHCLHLLQCMAFVCLYLNSTKR
jgi:hypothetical protein